VRIVPPLQHPQVRRVAALMACGWLLHAGVSWGIAGASPGDPPAASPSELPPELREVGFDQKLGDAVPLDLPFRDESGATIALSRYFDRRPVILSLVYYECPMLCSMALNGLVRSLRVVNLKPGEDFEIVTVSFSPRDTPALAAAKKQSYLNELRRPGAAGAWHFLTGDSTAIAALTQSVGFRYFYDTETKQYAHATGVVLLTPAGRIARTLYGIEPAPRDLRLGLVEAAQGRIGTVVDQALLYCFQYDPKRGTYAAAVLRIVRTAGVLTVAGVVLMILLLRRRDRPRAGIAPDPGAARVSGP
jgi:protein SCO1/2